MLMEDYIEQSKNLKNTLSKVKAVEINSLLEQINFEVFNIGIVGNNIKENKDILNDIKKNISNINIEEIEDLNYMGYDSVIIVLDAVQPISKGDIELYELMHEKCNDICFILKRLELVDEEDKEELLEYVKSKLLNVIGNNNVFILNEDKFMNNLIEEFKNLDKLKHDSISYKLKILFDESIKYLNESIDKIENWDKYKEEEISVLQSQIESINYFGEGMAIFLNELCNDLKKEDVQVSDTFYTDFINGINYVKGEYLGEEKNITDLNSSENFTKDELLQFIKEERSRINSEITDKIYVNKKEIDNLRLKHSLDTDVTIFKAALKEIKDIKGGVVSE